MLSEHRVNRVLVSFLGKTQIENSAGYRLARYDFGDGEIRETKFFGLALAEHLRPDRILLLGTRASMWDVFVESFQDGGDEDEALLSLRAELIDRVKSRNVTSALLDKLAPCVSAGLAIPCRMALVGYGLDTAEQLAILETIASEFKPGESATLDLTHGFRHLPMLSFVSALYLRAVLDISIDGLYYGALEMTEKEHPTPVLRLDGLLQVADWFAALQAFDKDADYAPFARLLEQAGVDAETASLLEQASFSERIQDLGHARGKLNKFAKVTDAGLPGIASLFQGVLDKRLSWRAGGTLYQRQQKLARSYFDKRDYLRACILAHEALITRSIQGESPGMDANKFENRDQAKQRMESKLPNRSPYLLLRDLRNALAHGSRPQRKEAQRALASEAAMRTTLGDLLNQLLPDETP